ncbi:DUF7144 family membrane protein [Actinoplanes utahensis]|uniref:Membrane protein n=1 Tax=Actinoplanes utahensis TaxID=1869 RepID=A0A0A6UD66_ACTUT|nr:hypothetical protein [Actinoplanes utahensis]KHD73416.1 membrane protein [Actinoplanes utahensis]GIF30186.1 hypothetical protein Aut01nite_31720 [Actinoplanes utahensis]
MRVEQSRATGWVAWVLFGGVMLVLLGTVHAYTGLVALARPAVLAGTRADLLLPIPLTGLAWAHLVTGAVLIVAGVGLIRGLSWARVTAIVLATGSALLNFTFAATHPIWSIIAIALSAVVIYSVAAHGGEVADAYGK